MLRKALKMEPRQVLEEMLASDVRGRGGAGFAMGKKMSFIPKGAMDKYLVLQRRRVRAGHVQGPRADAEEPASADRGDHHRRLRDRRQQVVHLHPRRVRPPGRRARRRARRGHARRATSASNILGSDHTLDLVVHRGAGAYICGEETALLDSLEGKRGNPRLKPPFPAVQGLYQGPTLINNVETLMNVPIILEMGGAEYAQDRHRDARPARRSSRSRAASSARATTRSSSARRRARSSTTSPAARAEGRKVKAGSPAARARRCSPARRAPRPALRLRLAGQGRLDARLGRDHRRRRLRPDRRRRAEDRRSSTATSRAASARRAARAPTGP